MSRKIRPAVVFTFIVCFSGLKPFEPASVSASFLAESTGQAQDCKLVERGYGPNGKVKVRAEPVVSGLEVPWGIMFLGNGEMLVTERAGRLRWVRNGKLEPEPVATVPTSAMAEGGLLGIVAHPEFAKNRLFYIYYTAQGNGGSVNRVERWRLAADARSAAAEHTILDNIPAARFHNGGRLRFGPDGMLYIGTGDAREPRLSQDPRSLAGKILRLTPDGQIPVDNPVKGETMFVMGIRNTQGFDWPDDTTMWITDHGPSGELGRRGHDEVNVARAGANLGWPAIYGCQSKPNMLAPMLTWQEAVPPGGAAIYTGNRIKQWRGSLLIGTLDSKHLQRVVFDPANPRRLKGHEVYFGNEFGRLREVIMGPDNELYVTTSNCDGRGQCPREKDQILRVTQ